MKAHGWVLKGPDGNLMPGTFSTIPGVAREQMYDYLTTQSEWAYASWDAVMRKAKKNGFVLVKVSLVEV